MTGLYSNPLSRTINILVEWGLELHRIGWKQKRFKRDLLEIGFSKTAKNVRENEKTISIPIKYSTDNRHNFNIKIENLFVSIVFQSFQIKLLWTKDLRVEDKQRFYSWGSGAVSSPVILNLFSEDE